MKENVLFILVTQIFSLGTWEYFVEDWAKNTPLFSTQQNTCAEEQFAIFSLRKCFSFLYFGREIFQTLKKPLRKSTQFFIFCVQETFWYFLPEISAFFGLELKCLSFGRTVFNTVFKSAFKVWKSVLGTWFSFVNGWAKKLRLFSQSS